MENRKLILFLFVFFLLFSLGACRRLVQDEFPDFTDKPTVNCILMDGKTIQVHISLAQKINAEACEAISHAEVVLYEDSLKIEQLSHTEKGLYISSVKAQAGKTYRLSIELPSFPLIEKSISVPKPEKILSVEHFNSAGVDEGGDVVPAVRIRFTNHKEKRAYYQLVLRCITTSYEGESYSFYPRALNITDPILLNESLPIWVFSNELISDTVYTMSVQYSTGSVSNGSMTLYPLILELRSIDEAYYQYLKSLYLYERGRFDSYIGEVFPTYPVYSNVANAYGIMGSFSSSISDTIIPEKKIYP